MQIRLGYVAISKTLTNVTSSSTLSYTNYLNNKDIDKINKVIISNLEGLEKIIDYNISNNIHFYRLTSKLIPLATMKNVEFDYIDKYKEYYKKISIKINNSNMRVDLHPDQFAVLNSTKKEVVENTFEILNYHRNILKALKIKNPIILLHIGSSVLGKDNSIKRFINNFNKLDEEIKNMIAIENDDKVFNIKDVLELCETLKVPFVLDYHHYLCNNEGENIEDYLERIFKTWKKEKPKIHFSSPKSNLKKEFRSHSEYINSDDFINFINILKRINIDVDIMLEAKGKDEALFRLVRELKYKTEYKFIDDTTFFV